MRWCVVKSVSDLLAYWSSPSKGRVAVARVRGLLPVAALRICRDCLRPLGSAPSVLFDAGLFQLYSTVVSRSSVAVVCGAAPRMSAGCGSSVRKGFRRSARAPVYPLAIIGRFSADCSGALQSAGLLPGLAMPRRPRKAYTECLLQPCKDAADPIQAKTLWAEYPVCSLLIRRPGCGKAPCRSGFLWFSDDASR